MPRPNGGYRLADGTKVPGVTDITGRYMDKSALIGWAFNRGKNGASALYDRSLDIGTVVHDMIDLQVKGRPFAEVEATLAQLGDSAAIDKARCAFRQFEQWKNRYHVEIEQREVSLVSERYRYGGTLDWLVRINGRRALLDFKTCKSPVAVYPDNLIQLAAYKPLWEENNAFEKIDGGFHLLRLPKDGGDFAHYYYKDLRTAFSLFVAYRKAYDLDQLIKAPAVLLGDQVPQAAKPKAAKRVSVPVTKLGPIDLPVSLAPGYVSTSEFLSRAAAFKPER